MQPAGELFLPPDVDQTRRFFSEKSRALIDKRMTVSEAVSRFIHDGDYIASGGFGGVRIATAVLDEIVRQRKRRLGFCGHTATHDFEILAAARAFDRCDAAYVVGLEVRGLSPATRRIGGRTRNASRGALRRSLRVPAPELSG